MGQNALGRHRLTVSLFEDLYTYQARTVEVVAPDIIMVDVSLGHEISLPNQIYALTGVKNPHADGSGEWRQARALLLELLSKNRHGDTIKIRTSKAPGEPPVLQAEVFVETQFGEILNVNERLLESGLVEKAET